MNNCEFFREDIEREKKTQESDFFHQEKCKGKIMLALLKRSYGKFSTICVCVTTIY